MIKIYGVYNHSVIPVTISDLAKITGASEEELEEYFMGLLTGEIEEEEGE